MQRLRWPKIDSNRFHDWAQGALAVVGIIAIVVGAALYFAERRDKPRVILQPRTTVVGITPQQAREGRLDAVLLQVSVAIENRSSRGLIFNCAAIDLIGLRGEEQRQPTYMDDLAGTSLLPHDQRSPTWSNCINRFERSRRQQERRLFEERSRSDQW